MNFFDQGPIADEFRTVQISRVQLLEMFSRVLAKVFEKIREFPKFENIEELLELYKFLETCLNTLKPMNFAKNIKNKNLC